MDRKEADATADKVEKCPIGEAWFLEILLKLDAHNVGFLRSFLTVGVTRQKLMKAACSVIDIERSASFLVALGETPNGHPTCDIAQTARALRSRKGRDILAAAFGECPKGFLPAVGRAQFGQRDSFRRLYKPFFERCTYARALAYSRLDDEALDVIDRLPVALIRPAFLSSTTRAEAIAAARAIRAISHFCPSAVSDDRLRQVETWKDFETLVEAAMELATFSEPPVVGDEFMIPLRNGHDLKAAASRFQNCLANAGFALDALSGRQFFYEWKEGDGAIVSLRRLAGPDVWMVGSIDGPRNRRVAPHVRDRIRTWFERRGVATTRRLPRSRDLDAISRILDPEGIGALDEFLMA